MTLCMLGLFILVLQLVSQSEWYLIQVLNIWLSPVLCVTMIKLRISNFKLIRPKRMLLSTRVFQTDAQLLPMIFTNPKLVRSYQEAPLSLPMDQHISRGSSGVIKSVFNQVKDKCLWLFRRKISALSSNFLLFTRLKASKITLMAYWDCHPTKMRQRESCITCGR